MSYDANGDWYDASTTSTDTTPTDTTVVDYGTVDPNYVDPWADTGGGSWWDLGVEGDSTAPEQQAALLKAASAAGIDPGTMKKAVDTLPKSTWTKLIDSLTTESGTDWAKVASLGLKAAGGAWNVNQALHPVKAGYQGTVPVLQATRQQVATDPNARPGAGGQRYFTDTQFTPAAGLPAAQAAATQQATTLAAANQAVREAPAAPAPMNYDAFFGRTPAQVAAQPQPVAAAHGGLMHAAKGRYLQGATDGMADKLPAQIGNDQPAKLSHGEFVIPADVVSHLGNGNSDAGAQQLYKMMAHIRKARTGNEDQGKRINPDKFMPGGLARAYAAGGEIKGFDGTTGSTVSAPAGATGMEQTLSSYAAPYVTDMLSRGQALAQQPYQAYQGPLTAGPSALQQQGFGASGALQTDRKSVV